MSQIVGTFEVKKTNKDAMYDSVFEKKKTNLQVQTFDENGLDEGQGARQKKPWIRGAIAPIYNGQWCTAWLGKITRVWFGMIMIILHPLVMVYDFWWPFY
jgi:hypothetical protein